MGRLFGKMRSVIEGLPSPYFAMVMATGIVSIACHLLGIWFIAYPLLWMNIAFYLWLWLLTILRIIFYPRRFYHDFTTHNSGAGYFTMIAGTGVLGSQLILLKNAFTVGVWLLYTAVGLWSLLIYLVFTAFITRGVKPSLEKGINGAWLVATVGTQSISILSAMVVSQFPTHREFILLFSFHMFMVGGILYIMTITLIFYRFMFFKLTPEELTPPYWINAGADAISTLAGATLVAKTQGSPFLEQLRPFTLGFTLFFWSTATWWIPLLFLLGFWRYVVRRDPFTYNAQYWGMVFPLGMYTACTYHLSEAANLPFIMEIPRYFIYVALTAWFLTFFGFLSSTARYFLSGEGDQG